MFKYDYTYEELLESLLSKVPNTIDKREGSIIYDTLAPVALELAQHYSEIGNLINLLYADTAPQQWLDRFCEQFGVDRRQSSPAIRKAEFYDREDRPMKIPLGARFAINDLTMYAEEELSSGVYLMRTEQHGLLANQYQGAMLPLTPINNLGSAILSDVVIDGLEIEDDDSYRERFYKIIRKPAFGGNIADYERRILELEGVGNVKIFPVWNGPGTVKVIIGDHMGGSVDQLVIQRVQNEVMPEESDKLGYGIAPIGHTTAVSSSTDLVVDISATVILEQGYGIEDIEEKIKKDVAEYIATIKFTDSVIYHAKVIAALLQTPQVIDVRHLLINNVSKNLVLSKTPELYQTPKIGNIQLEVVT